MEYHRTDYEELYGDHWLTRSSSRSRLMVYVVIFGWVLILALLSSLAGCDGEAAQITAYAEAEAHQRHVDVLLATGWVKYAPTVTPIRASDLGATFTACQQRADRKWECVSK